MYLATAVVPLQGVKTYLATAVVTLQGVKTYLATAVVPDCRLLQ